MTVQTAKTPFIVRQTEAIRKNDSHNLAWGYVHIPKTGGSALSDYFNAAASTGTRHPVKFGHRWRICDITKTFPEMRLCFVLRDPLERIISGFGSRLRMGRPRNNSHWRPEEATAFSIFRDVDSFCEALTSEDEFQRSAVDFAMNGVTHLAWGYDYYFGSVEQCRQSKDKFSLIGSINNMDTFIGQLSKQAMPDLPSGFTGNFAATHVSTMDNGALAKSIDREKVMHLHPRLQSEYDIFNHLAEAVISSHLPNS